MSDPVAGNAAPPHDAAAASTPPTDPATTPEANLIDTKLLANELVKNLDAPVAENQITPSADPGPEVKFKLVYNKTNYEIVMGENRTVRELKDHIETLTKLPRAMQKLMFKGYWRLFFGIFKLSLLNFLFLSTVKSFSTILCFINMCKPI